MVCMGNVPLLDEIVRRLVQTLRPERIYLFGSRARGEASEESDFDLLVVVSTSELPGHVRDSAALRALKGLNASVDVLVLTREEFERKVKVVCSLPATVLREGKLLHAA
jgi:uncharacterized protein